MRWPPYKHVFFDCDSTLTTVEGIDILAETAGKKWRVEVLTRAAMDGELDLEEVYGKRLQAVRPTRRQIRDIRNIYKRHVVKDAAAVIAALQTLAHHVYIISGGLAEPVIEFGVSLGVPRQNIRAVDVAYDALSGAWWRSPSDHLNDNERYLAFQESALTVSDGKAQIVKEFLHNQKGRSLLIGDGSSDLLASSAVDLFVGFGGVVERARVRAAAPVFIHSRSLAPVLALAAGPAMLSRLPHTLGKSVRALIERGAITFNDERLKTKFHEAYQAVYPRTD